MLQDPKVPKWLFKVRKWTKLSVWVVPKIGCYSNCQVCNLIDVSDGVRHDEAGWAISTLGCHIEPHREMQTQNVHRWVCRILEYWNWQKVERFFHHGNYNFHLCQGWRPELIVTCKDDQGLKSTPPNIIFLTTGFFLLLSVFQKDWWSGMVITQKLMDTEKQMETQKRIISHLSTTPTMPMWCNVVTMRNRKHWV